MSRSRRRSSRQGCGINLFNVLTIFILGTAVLIFLGVVLVIAMPDLIPASVRQMVGSPATSTPAPLPTAAAIVELPTETATLPGGPLAATWTPVPTEVEVGVILLPTNTRRPTITPSVSPSLPPLTNTPPQTNPPTATPTEGPPPPMSNTPSPPPL